MTAHPPKPELSLSIGVFGHRPNRLPGAALDRVAEDIAAVLDALETEAAAAGLRHRDVFAPGKPELTIVSALAEGADRMVAEAGLVRGLHLDAPLPFPVDAYALDFRSEAALAEYHDLLGKARRVLELPGSRAARSAAYERVGVTILGVSDFVIAIWDGGAAAGRGGTTSMVTAAMRMGMPIVHIDATGAVRPRVLWGGFARMPAHAETLDSLPALSLDVGMRRLVDELVRPPSEAEERRHLERYYGERARRFNVRIEFPMLMALAGVRRLCRADLWPRNARATAEAYCAPATALLASTGMSTPTDTALSYGWASAVGGYFGQVFRSAYVSNFVFGALSVAAAAASLIMGAAHNLAIVEVLLMGLVILNTWIGRHAGWHRRWIEAREIAERLRVATCVWALADRPAAFRGEEPTWTGWYARAFVRMQGLRSGALDGAGLEEARRLLVDLLADQRNYHHGTAVRMGTLERRLESFGLALFILTAAIALDHATGGHGLHAVVPHGVNAGLLGTTLGAALPALAVASYGIRVIGDIDGIARRSEHARAVLDELHGLASAEPPDLVLLRARARSTVDAMLGDVANWRLSAESRPLALPG
ncbi:MAG: hypothetical protein DYH14_08970 [Betaproteobacteria bacterium PRO3]|nr:hypothetical protein [Betaproteobacteria bacterium PRO3]